MKKENNCQPNVFLCAHMSVLCCAQCEQVPLMCSCSLGSSFELASRSCSILHEVRAFVQSYTRRMERSICDYSQIQTNCIAPFFLQSELLSHRRLSQDDVVTPKMLTFPFLAALVHKVPSIKNYVTARSPAQICFGPYISC